ncbi:MAG: cytochrome C, partial [Geobacter sp.]|nr:cytochrome C [Geobacter sp.]
LCNTCHTSEQGLMTYAKVEEESAGYQNAGLYLTNLITNTVVNYKNAAIVYSATGDDYKAFQNSKLTSDERGGFVHNRIYVKRLIFDSIDWLDNGALNGTITIPAAYAEARAWFGADAAGVVAKRP